MRNCSLLLLATLLASALVWGRPAFSGGLPILVYHEIRTGPDGPTDGPTAISLQRFESQMETLHRLGYATLSMDEVVAYVKGAPFPPKVVAIHFDDGWKSAREALPVLDRYGFKATFWIIAGTGIGWPHMEWDEIEAIERHPLHDVQSHTMTHPWKDGDTLPDWAAGRVPGKGEREVRWELAESRRVLEAKLARPVPYLAWPRGLYTDSLIEVARESGYSALLSIDDGLNLPGADLLRLRRTMIHGGCGRPAFEATLADGMHRDCPVTQAW